METTKHVSVLSPQVIQSFAGVRGRVKAAVEKRRRSVTLTEALAQVERIQKAGATSKSIGERIGKPISSESGCEAVGTPIGTK